MQTRTEAPGCSAPAGNVHLVSWNVAGWQTTLERIRRFRGGFPTFLERHHVDILCLQETKLNTKQLTEDAIKLGAEAPGFESFWACNEGTGAQRSGLNGVATLARRGTVLRADCQPLGDQELDREGRCLLTDHGAFVLFNVYVPNSAGGRRLPYKLRFLRALHAAMQRERAGGKAVILAGDLNMKSRPADSHWTWRPVEAGRLGELAARHEGVERPLSGEARAAAEAITACWPSVAAALRQKEHRPFETKNSRSGQTFQRWGVFAKAQSGDVVRLGPPLEEELWARHSFNVDGCGVEEDGSLVLGPGYQEAAHVLQRPGVMSITDLAECVRRLAGVELAPKALKSLASEFGRLAVAPAVSDWLDAMLRRDGMVDSFAALHPTAEERFTCWDQYKNKRHENVGGRIDYVLVDRQLFDQHARKGAELAAHGRAGAQAAPGSAEAALSAATLGGLSEPSSFAGGGMPPLSEEEYLAQFRDAPATGMLYTPPQLSDHIAVTLLLQDLPPGPSAAAAAAPPRRDAASAKCQPHRSAKRITDFFSSKRPAAAAAAGPPPPAKRVALGAA